MGCMHMHERRATVRGTHAAAGRRQRAGADRQRSPAVGPPEAGHDPPGQFPVKFRSTSAVLDLGCIARAVPIFVTIFWAGNWSQDRLQ